MQSPFLISSKIDLTIKENIIKIISGLIIVVFFTLYTHSGFVSGGKLFESAFGLNYHFGLILVAVIVIAYTFSEDI